LTTRAAALQAKITTIKKELALREAKILFDTYQDVFAAVRYHSEINGIAVVHRFNSERADPNIPDDVLRELNKSVVYYHPKIDITDAVLAMVNQGTTRPAPTASRTNGPQAKKQ
jgi:Skp family chaperone for outer membrane proteins